MNVDDYKKRQKLCRDSLDCLTSIKYLVLKSWETMPLEHLRKIHSALDEIDAYLFSLE